MNEKKKNIKFVYGECFEETLLTNNNITFLIKTKNYSLIKTIL